MDDGASVPGKTEPRAKVPANDNYDAGADLKGRKAAPATA
jgi:hypothetical protein